MKYWFKFREQESVMIYSKRLLTIFLNANGKIGLSSLHVLTFKPYTWIKKAEKLCPQGYEHWRTISWACNVHSKNKVERETRDLKAHRLEAYIIC